MDSMKPLHVLAGPYAVENLEVTSTVASEVKRVLRHRLGLPFHIKVSYRKSQSYPLVIRFMALSDQEALEVLAQIKQRFGCRHCLNRPLA